MKLLSTGNPKILKGIEQGYNTYILHLAPAKSKHGCGQRASEPVQKPTTRTHTQTHNPAQTDTQTHARACARAHPTLSSARAGESLPDRSASRPNRAAFPTWRVGRRPARREGGARWTRMGPRARQKTHEHWLSVALGELDMAPELLRGRAGHVAAVVLEDQGVATRRHDEELRDHGVARCVGPAQGADVKSRDKSP